MSGFDANTTLSFHPAGRNLHRRLRHSEESLIDKAARVARPTPRFEAKVERHRGLVVIRLRGELDVAQLRQLPALQRQGDRSTPVLVDLSGLTFVDLAAIRELLHAKEQSLQHGHTFILSGARGAVRRLFELTGAQGLLRDRDTLPSIC